MQPKIVTLLGISGSGKGTQANMLMDKFGLAYVGSGELLRARVKKNDFTGKKIDKIISRGGFVPTTVIFGLWLKKWEELKRAGSFRGFVIDGSPRKLLEAEMIDQTLEWYEWTNFFKVVLIDVSSQEVTHRLSNRRTCRGCSKMYSYLKLPKQDGVCDSCGGKLTRRNDDTPEGIKGRISEFNQETKPVIEYYKKQGRLLRVNGEQSIEDVHKDILSALRQSK